MSIKFGIVYSRKFIYVCSQDLDTWMVCSMGIRAIPSKAPNICPMIWSPHWVFWLTLNNDDLPKS